MYRRTNSLRVVVQLPCVQTFRLSSQTTGSPHCRSPSLIIIVFAYEALQTLRSEQAKECHLQQSWLRIPNRKRDIHIRSCACSFHPCLWSSSQVDASNQESQPQSQSCIPPERPRIYTFERPATWKHLLFYRSVSRCLLPAWIVATLHVFHHGSRTVNIVG